MKVRTQPGVLTNCRKATVLPDSHDLIRMTFMCKIVTAVNFMTSHWLIHVFTLLQIINKELPFSYLEDTLIEKKANEFGTVGKWSNVVCQVSCWHKKIAVGLLSAFDRTANKIRLNFFKRSPPTKSRSRAERWWGWSPWKPWKICILQYQKEA